MTVQHSWRSGLAVLAIGLLAVAGCGGKEETAEPRPRVPETAGEAPAPEPAPEKAKLRPEELQPVIREVAAAGVAPTKVVIELAQPVVDEGQVGKPPGAGTRLRIEPAVDGETRFTSPSTLTFTPARGFASATRYEVELQALETRDGILEAPAPGRWVRLFETPAFDFVRFSLGGVEYPKNRAEVDLVFSAAVDPAEVSRRARIVSYAPDSRVAGKTRLRFERGAEAHTARAVVAAATVEPGGRIELELDAGVPSAADPERRAGSSRATLELERGPLARVLKVYRAEGTNGFYVQVICDDQAAGGERYYWDREIYESYRLSRRCVADEADAAAGIRFEPAVDFTIAPAGGGFRIFGDFARGSYQMRIDAGVRTVDGGMLHQTYETDFTVPARSPSIAFVSQGRYLPRSAWKSIPVRHLNVSGATLTVRHVRADNLVFWMSDDQESAGERTSDLILKQQLPLAGDTDVATTSYVDLGSLVPASTKGLLEVRLAAGEAQAAARILLTDLQLVAKRGGPSPAQGTPDPRKIHVWALDVDSVEPLYGVNVSLVRKSGYVVAACNTRGGDGCDLIPNPAEIDPSPPFALVARRGDDLTYLKFDELAAEVQETRIAGEPYRGEKKYRAAVYSDRGVYRPGETAHLAAIVRGETHEAPPQGMPVLALLVDPQGKTVKRTTLETNAAGYLELDFGFPAFATTGRYEARLEVAERPIGQYRFQVEEFVPERMRVEANPEEPEYRLGDAVRVAVAARYLFGGVPAGHRLEIGCELQPSIFDPPQNANFHYGVWLPEDQPQRPLDLGTATHELDAEGGGTFVCPGSGPGAGRRGPSFRGPAKVVARAAVFESGSGRTTVGRAEAPVHPERYYLGLQTGATQVEAGSDLVVQGVTVDWRGHPVADVATVAVEFLRLEAEYSWYYDENLGYETYRRYLRPVTEATVEAEVVAGAFRAVWKPSRDGAGFLVRATAGNARTELQLEGRGGWYYWGPGDSEVDQTPRPGRPTWLALNAPDKVRLGERFGVQLKVPYRGRVLLTAETDEIVESEWRQVEAGDLVWFVELEDFEPNVYLTAFLVKDPHLDSAEAFLPDRAFGVRSVRVEPAEFAHQLALEAPAEVRSGSRLTVKLDLGKSLDRDGPTYATVAAVDEGILSLTRFESPDPFAAVFTRRALGVETFETIGWTLLVPPAGPSDAAGGDGMGELGRVQPVKPVALWSGLVEVPESGELEVSFELPSYRGELRVMAVTAGRKKMGRADAAVTVRDPLVVQSTLPRFLTRGDEIRIPVAVTNLSGERREVEVELASEALAVAGLLELEGGAPPVEILGNRRQTLALDHGAAGTALFRARANRPTGAARLTVTARSGELRSVEEAEVPLLPAGPKSRVVQRIELAAGTTDLTAYLEGWVPLSERSTLWVTSNPYGQSFDHLKHLVRYPYGCIEQTVSSTRPLLYLARFIDRVDPEILAEGTIEDRVKRGIERLLSMQAPAGGFSYWPGATEPVYWGTANAVHLLLDARDLDYPVPGERIDEALAWMERQVSGYYEAGSDRDDWHGHGAEPYFHFVLARAGRAQKARIEKLLANLPASDRGREREDRFLLQAALHMAGDQRYEAELQRPDLSPVSGERANDWTFYSDRRRRGFMLATFVDLFGRDPAGEPLANLVAESIRGRASGWYTTQELVWSLTGLGKFVAVGAKDFSPPVLRANGRRIAPQAGRDAESQPATAERVWNLARASEYRELALDLDKKGEGKLYLILSSEGVREVPDWRTGGEGLRLARRYLDAAGAPLDLRAGRLGDLVYVELTVENVTPERIANIALVDRVPAGWEIENPRLGRDGSVEWIDADLLWQADHMDLRDDRLEVFGHLERGEKRQVVYAVRAVTAGTFTVPAVEAEAMYDPRIWAREGMGKAVIAGPWGETVVAAPVTGGIAAGVK